MYNKKTWINVKYLILDVMTDHKIKYDILWCCISY